MEDEWFVVGLLRELTLRDHDLVVRITDQDGELLLIETADHLPRLADIHMPPSQCKSGMDVTVDITRLVGLSDISISIDFSHPSVSVSISIFQIASSQGVSVEISLSYVVKVSV